MNASGSPGGDGGGPVVQHLPPVTLRVAFPPGYPDDGPPAARLLAEWLAPAQAASLQQRLADVWEEQGPGVPVIYAWVEWLESEALSHLGIGDTLTLAAREPPPQQQLQGPQQGDALDFDSAADPGSMRASGCAPAPAGEAAGHRAEVSGRPARGRAGDAKFGDEGASSSSGSGSDGVADDERGAGLGQQRQAGQGKGGGGPDALLLRLLAYSAYREAHLFRQVCGGQQQASLRPLVCWCSGFSKDRPGRLYLWLPSA